MISLACNSLPPHLCPQFCPFPAHSSCEVSLSHGSIPPPSIPCAFYSKPRPLLEPPDCLFALLPPPWPCPLSHRQTDTRSGPFQSEITLCHYLASALQGDHSGLLAAFTPAKLCQTQAWPLLYPLPVIFSLSYWYGPLPCFRLLPECHLLREDFWGCPVTPIHGPRFIVLCNRDGVSICVVSICTSSRM